MKKRIILCIVAFVLIYGACRHAPLEASLAYISGAIFTWAIFTWRSNRESKIVKEAVQVARAFLFENGPLGENCKKLSRALIDGGYDVNPR